MYSLAAGRPQRPSQSWVSGKSISLRERTFENSQTYDQKCQPPPKRSMNVHNKKQPIPNTIDVADNAFLPSDAALAFGECLDVLHKMISAHDV